MRVVGRVGIWFIMVVATLSFAACTQNTTTAPSTTTPSGNNTGLVTVTSSPPTFVVGIAGNIDVKLAGTPTKASSIKMDFGDQSSATMSAITSATFTHAYSRAGTFGLNVSVIEPDGSVVTATAEISVLP
jgi:hypothetical protein